MGPEPRDVSRIDLHTHTSASDGTLTPEELVRTAAALGLEFLGIADHDTTDGLTPAISEAEQFPDLTIIPAVELSATSERGGAFHLLGYCIAPDAPGLQGALEDFRRTRDVRVEQIVARLREHGSAITLDQVMDKAAGGAVSRAHIGRVLVDLEEAESIDAAFSSWLGRNRPAFVPREPLFAEDAVRLIRDAGGVSVLAHPLTMGDYRRQLPELIDAGLRGIEAYYGPYTDEERSRLLDIATRNGLIVTGGSDYHGPEQREGRELGGVAVPESVLDELQRLAPGCL